MRNERTRSLSISEAAGLIYATNRPSPAQIDRVEEKLRRGDLHGNRTAAGAKWTTTADDVAEYLAEQALRRHLVPGSRSDPGTKDIMTIGEPTDRQVGESQLRQAYDEVFKEYFLAVIFRRNTRRASRWFRRAVLAGQIGFLLLLATACVMSVRLFSPATSPGHAAIEQWIEHRSGPFTVIRWHEAKPDPRGEGTAIRVEYRYSASRGKSIQTDRLFVIDDGRVVRVDSEW